MPHAEKAAAKPVKKKVKEPVEENSNISTMPTTEYVKGIYAAAAENGMGAPEVNAVKKQMVLAPNGEVDIIATMQKAVQVFQSPAWKKMIADLTALVKKAEAQQAMSSGINELSSELLGRYKKAAGADAKKADAEGDYARGNKRFSGIVRATKKQFANDEKSVEENYWDRLQRERALESAGVGIITKQNSTVDVNKNTPKKNLKAFRLI